MNTTNLPDTASTIADAALLRLMWLASPALPVGAFSYSEGLEAAVDAGLVHDAASAGEWLRGQLELALARAELPLVAQAFAAWRAGDAARIAALNDWSLATRETAELRAQSEQTGRALLAWLRHDGGRGDDVAMLARLDPAPTWPIAFALAAARHPGVTPRAALLACAFGWAENAAQAALKAVPLGQVAAQRLLARLAEAIPDAVERALATGDDARQAFAPQQAILSARHEAQYSRLFRS